MEPSNTTTLEPGSIAEVTARLRLWGRRAPKGIARVEYTSEFARQEVVSQLQAEFEKLGIPFQEIELPVNQTPFDATRFLIAKLNEIPKGVVSVSGFASAFPASPSLVEALGVLNFQRENLAVSHLCQIWWMTPQIAEVFIRSLLDLNSWFVLKLELTEHRANPELISNLFEIQPSSYLNEGFANPEDARWRSAVLMERFERAVAQGPPSWEVFHQLAVPAIRALQEAKLTEEANVLREKLLKYLPKPSESAAQIPKSSTTDSIEVVHYLNTLVQEAEAFQNLSQHSAAIDRLQKALQVVQEVDGMTQDDSAFILNELGGAYLLANRFEEAELIFKQTLDVLEKPAPPNQPSIAVGLNNLAQVYIKQSRLVEAEKLLERSIQLWEKSSGLNHLEGAGTLNSLASIYSQQGRFQEAETLFKRSLRIREQTLGSEHPNTASVLQNLANLYANQHKFSQAIPLYQQALKIFEKQLGPDSIPVAVLLEAFARVYLEQGQPTEAAALQQRAQAIRQKVSQTPKTL